MAVRSAIILLAVAGLVTSISAVAVGLGEIRLNSTINQPLSADIELLSVEGRDPSHIRARLGTPEDFSRAGIDRPFFLTELGFRTDLDNPGGPVIRVTSSRPVREPFVDFLVRLEWPDGQLLRSYTLLLDLPDHGFGGAPRTSSVVPSGPATFDSQPAASDRPSAQPLRRPSPPSIPAGSDAYTVRSGDTLWSVASRVRPEGLTVQQTLMAIYELNPDAFINGDMNRLRRDYTLSLPERSRVAAVDPGEARSAVWRDAGDSAPAPQPIDATERQPQAVADVSEGGQLRLAAPDVNGAGVQGVAANGADTGDTAGSVGEGVEGGVSASNGLALAEEVSGRVVYLEEEVLLTRRENQELQERIGNLEEQLLAMSRLVELQSDTAAAQPAPRVVDQPDAPRDGMMRNLLWVLLGIAVLVALWALVRWRRQPELLNEAEWVTPTAGATADPEFPPMSGGGDARGAKASGAALAAGAGIMAGGIGAGTSDDASEADEHSVQDSGFGAESAFGETPDDGTVSELPDDESPLFAEQADEPVRAAGVEQGGQAEVDLNLDMTDLDLSQDDALGVAATDLPPGEEELSLEEWFADFEQDQADKPGDVGPESLGGAPEEASAAAGIEIGTEAPRSGAAPFAEPDVGFDLDFGDLAAEEDALADRDPLQTRLELARVYIDMQDAASAREILEELIEAGNPEQQSEARELLGSLD